MKPSAKLHVPKVVEDRHENNKCALHYSMDARHISMVLGGFGFNTSIHHS